ncbi:MAG: hypothetical protein HQL82_04980 [Magnetococcales bacterium]|nr:hypothetical protein [Magnetococcales bacterium]
MDPDESPRWDCRWPDPVALKVAMERFLLELGTNPDAVGDLHPTMPILVRMETDVGAAGMTTALLVTPWGVERVYWHRRDQGAPPVESAIPLDGDAQGLVDKDQGVLLALGDRLQPALTAWEPETGHYFVETLLHSVRDLNTAEQALAVATGLQPPPPPGRSLTGHMQQPVSRRDLFDLFRRESANSRSQPLNRER